MAAFSKLVFNFRRLLLTQQTQPFNFPLVKKRPLQLNLIKPQSFQHFIPLLNLYSFQYKPLPKIHLLSLFKNIQFATKTVKKEVTKPAINYLVLYIPTPQITPFEQLKIDQIHEIRKLADQQYNQLMSLSQVLHVLFSLNIRNVSVNYEPKLSINVAIPSKLLGELTVDEWVNKLGLISEYEIQNQDVGAKSFLEFVDGAEMISNCNSGYDLRKRVENQLFALTN